MRPPANPLSRDLPGMVRLLADHLDAILAAGEDLRAQRVSCLTARSGATSGNDEPTDPACDDAGDTARDTPSGDCPTLRSFVITVGAFEGAALLRTLRAREVTRQVLRHDPRFQTIGRLFMAGTSALADALLAVGNERSDVFDTAGCPLEFLRSRGLISADAGSLLAIPQIEVDESYLLAGHIELGPLMDLAAAYLDALEIHFDLFPPTSALDGATNPPRVAGTTSGLPAGGAPTSAPAAPAS